MTRIVLHGANGASLDAEGVGLNVLLYESKPLMPGIGYIGNHVRPEIARLGAPTDPLAFDFLTISLSVIAADTFVSRERESGDGWCREMELTIPLIMPEVWGPLSGKIERIIGFLSGDTWKLKFTDGGSHPPTMREIEARRRTRIDLSGVDCVSLFSGGLDSFIGVADIVAAGRRPVLVSQAYRGDRKYQNSALRNIDEGLPIFQANFNAKASLADSYETTMRARSFGFLGYSVAVASAVANLKNELSGPVDIFVPENGFIALNVPLTRRRVGSHSTRTTHPHFLDGLQDVLNRVGLNFRLVNPYRHQTKGEMVTAAVKSGRSNGALFETISCGHWKRHNQPCGYCLPCLIRMAAFHKAGVCEPPSTYRYAPVDAWRETKLSDDIKAVLLAGRAGHDEVTRRAFGVGPLPRDPQERAAWIDVCRRGLDEVNDYLVSCGVRI